MLSPSTFVMLTNKDGIHNYHKYKEGLNIVKVNVYRKENIDFRIGYSDSCRKMYWIWDVSIPDDANTVDLNYALQTDKFILTNKRFIWIDNELCKLAVQ